MPARLMATQPPTELLQAWRSTLREAGMRVTQQREALLVSVWRMRHATAESLVVELERSNRPMNLSTVYRGLDALQQVGLVRHAHLGSGGPTYHIAVEARHLHLQCTECGRVTSLGVAFAADFVAAVAEQTGFAADIAHGAIYGRCAGCTFAADTAADEDGV